MRALLLPVLSCLAACGGQAQTVEANALAAVHGPVCGGCGGSSGSEASNESDNESLAVAACVPELTPAQRAPLEARARGGDVEAMMDLAVRTESMPEKRRWYAEAAGRGNCNAISHLTETYEGSVGSGLSPAERRRWVAEDRRLGCGVPRWAREDGALVYGAPSSPLFDMWVGCTGGQVRIAVFRGAMAPGERLFRTSRGVQSRMMRRADDIGAPAYDAAPDDEVLAALLRGERIEVRSCADCPPVAIDGSGARALLAAQVRQCTGRAS